MEAWLIPLATFVGGVVASYVFYRLQVRRRQLVYAISPVRTALAISGQVKDLTVSFRHEPLGNCDVTAVHIAIWNAGAEPINPESIRRKIELVMEPGVRVLDVSNRNWFETELQLPESPDSWAHGRVPISWPILERREGASIQLTYLGKPDIEVKLEGLIVGQGHPRRILSNRPIHTTEQHHTTQRQILAWLAVSFMLSLALGVVLFGARMKDSSGLLMLLFEFSCLSLAGSLIALLGTLTERIPPGDF